MMSKLILTAAILFAAFTVNAQYTGAKAKPKTLTVSEINKKAAKLDNKDELVEITGHITSQIDSETYWLSDSTGKIKVQIDKNKLPAQPFNETNLITIVGEVDYDLLEGTEIEAKRPVVVNQEK